MPRAAKHATHPSMQRLLAFAREVTRGSRAPVDDYAAVGRRLDKSPAVLTNWKQRGISKDGAMQAELVFGCSARWVMTGEGLAHAALSDEAIQRASVWERLDQRGREFFDQALTMARLADELAAAEPPPPPYAAPAPAPAGADPTNRPTIPAELTAAGGVGYRDHGHAPPPAARKPAHKRAKGR